MAAMSGVPGTTSPRHRPITSPSTTIAIFRFCVLGIRHSAGSMRGGGKEPRGFRRDHSLGLDAAGNLRIRIHRSRSRQPRHHLRRRTEIAEFSRCSGRADSGKTWTQYRRRSAADPGLSSARQPSSLWCFRPKIRICLCLGTQYVTVTTDGGVHWRNLGNKDLATRTLTPDEEAAAAAAGGRGGGGRAGAVSSIAPSYKDRERHLGGQQ